MALSGYCRHGHSVGIVGYRKEAVCESDDASDVCGAAGISDPIVEPVRTRSAAAVLIAAISATPKHSRSGLRPTLVASLDDMPIQRHGVKKTLGIRGNGGGEVTMDREIQDGIAQERPLKSTSCRRWDARYKTRWTFRPIASILVETLPKGLGMEMTGTFQTAETGWVDLRLSHLRQRDRDAEEVLLESIRTEGIKQPLVVVLPRPNNCLLLDGFKRYRCARRLSIHVVPILAVEGDERDGLLALLRHSRDKGLTELEHGAVVDRLHTSHGMSVSQIAVQLGCSPAWVSLRLGMVNEMSALVRRKVLSGQFPPRAYLYGVRPFTRVEGVHEKDVGRFVTAVSGRDLSTRELFLLTHAYFEGSRGVKTRIEQGDVQQVLEALKSKAVPDGGCGVQAVLDDVRSIVACMTRLTTSLEHQSLDGEVAPLQAHLACAGLLKRISPFTRSLRRFYGRTTEAIGSVCVVGAGQEQEPDRTLAGAGREDSPGDHCQPWATAQPDIPLSSTASA